MKNRTIIGIICIILAIAVMFGASPIINSITSGKLLVCQVNKVIKQGQLITSNDVVNVEIGSYGVKGGVIKDEKLLVGKFAKSDIYPNINIYPQILSSIANSADDIFKTLDGTQQAMSISIDSFADGLSGKLQNGDIVSIIVVSNSDSVIPPELTYVKVITTTTAKGTDGDKVTQNKDGTTDLPATVTLLVNKKQATLLAKYEINSKMHIALVYRGTVENANKFLESQAKVFNSEVK